ncbi:MAG: flagellar basal body-associated FliL family protein [Lachnospiraceae bacterium]|nr:flagellar basal body-associated FliL family protein [Lachnospiraceae bacterium]
MKRNMLSILILALLVVNLVLTAIMMFSVMGSSRKTSALIDDISSVLKLELDNQSATGGAVEYDVAIDDMATYTIEEELTIPLMTGADGQIHYYLIAATLSMNTKHDDYKKYGESVADYESLIKGEISSVVGSHTLEEMQSDIDSVRREVLERVQKLYDSDFIFNVTFTKAIPQ